MRIRGVVTAAVAAAAVAAVAGVGPTIAGAQPGSVGHGSKVFERESGRELHVGDVIGVGRATGKRSDGTTACEIKTATNVDTAVDPSNDVSITFGVTDDCRVVIDSITPAKPSGEAPTRGEVEDGQKTEVTR